MHRKGSKKAPGHQEEFPPLGEMTKAYRRGGFTKAGMLIPGQRTKLKK